MVKTLFVFILALSLSSLAFADRLSMKVERDLIEQGDIISLWVEADFQTLGNTLEYRQLDENFEVLSRQRSNFYEFVNGVSSAKTRWHLRLLPKKTGKLIIPAVTLGDISSQSLIIEVKQANQSGTSNEQIAFMRAEVENAEGFVQQQFLYRLRLYYQGKMLPGTGNMRPPIFKDALSETLQDEQTYSTVIDGKNYTVHEWIYALFPQSSGELTIAPSQIRGLLNYNGHQKVIETESNAVTLTVKPAADLGQNYSNAQPWLPAASMLLESQWQTTPSDIKVGDSLSRVLTLQAYGLKASQLPVIEAPDGNGYKVYNQPAQSSEEKFASGVVSRIQITQNFVPTQAGEMRIPAYQLRWFNTANQAFETLQIEAQTFNIQAATGQVNYPTIDQTKPISQAAINQENTEKFDWLIWPLLTTIFAIAWVLTLIMWWLARGQKRQSSINPATAETEAANPALTQQQWCQAEDKTFYQHLRKHLLTELHIHHLAELKNRNADELRQKIQRFENNLYAPDAQTNKEMNQELKQQICTLIGKLKRPTESKKTWTKKTELQALYPKTKQRPS
ncbi:hypothetical protein THMIRHAS_00950 [Thiosulfatimonas sediminis]|uniref:Protein BatD n=1 Tax=Thiosulfatimonas sediminis TaxID=2675054 RepID=A0A6F8PRG2_9GAMM|nr:BatD family protein [Thiosulfatimonas sediminis]BBP44722.1 hypothetical protein THMIRHAS_00950 [Thiosulfatimonas sediminis]